VADVIRAFLWGVRASVLVRPRLRRYGPGVELPPVPVTVGGRGERTVRVVCRLTRLNCLQSALVRQAWAAGHGQERRLIVGVTSPSDGFEAHAWLEGDPEDPRFTTLRTSPQS
jgi:hypothetical protein